MRSSSSCPGRILRYGCKGAALPVVLIFAVIAFISTSAYIFGQFEINKPLFKTPARLQALLNARSGIWMALDSLRGRPRADTLPTLNTLDTSFKHGLFGPPADTAPSAFSIDTMPVQLHPYPPDSFGIALVSLTAWGGFRRLRSEGVYRDIHRHAEALIGGRPPFRGDTLLYLPGPVPGLATRCIANTHTGISVLGKEKRDTLLRDLTKRYREELAYDSLYTLAPKPLSIQRNDDLPKVPPTVHGDLLIDGAFWELKWTEERTVRVLGDLQLSGTVSVEKLRFVVLGEVKILDKSTCSRVSIFSASRVFIGGQSSFSGDLLAAGAITIYETARVVDRSSLTSTGTVMSGQSPAAAKTAGPAKRHGGGTKARADSAQVPRYGVVITGDASVDATVVALGSPGSILTGPNTVARGILYAEKDLAHEGALYGIARAGRLVDGRNPLNIIPNVVVGCIKKLSTVGEYRFPCFLGTPAVVAWKED